MIKKISFVVYNFSDYGGVNSIVSELINELTNRYEITLISIVNDKREWAYQLNNGIKYKSFLKESHSLRKDFFNVFKIAYCYFKKEKFDIIFLEGHYTGFLISILQLFINAKMVFVDHGALINQWDEIKVRIMRWISSKMCKKTITLTEKNKNDYIQKFHISEKKVLCIYNWIDIKKMKTEKYNINSKKIISVGRFGKEKGFNQLIDAFTLVVKKHPDWQLDIYGDGETMPQIKKMIDQNELEENVNLLGMRKDVMKFYKNYAMYVLPSYREGLPLVLLEAKINKLPIISFDIMTGPREIIRNNVDGILVPPKDIIGLANAICMLIENCDLRQDMSKNTLKNINNFSKETILKQWIELIENM